MTRTRSGWHSVVDRRLAYHLGEMACMPSQLVVCKREQYGVFEEYSGKLMRASNECGGP